MIILNNLIKILILLFFYSCAVTTDVPKIIKKKAEVSKEDQYFEKKDIFLSPLEEYEIDFRASEKFLVDNKIVGINKLIHINENFLEWTSIECQYDIIINGIWKGILNKAWFLVIHNISLGISDIYK